MNKNFLKDINVLYVEDEDSIRELTASFLSGFVRQLVAVKDGKEGLDAFTKNYNDEDVEKFDLIITDINMPKMNGLQMLEEISKINHLIPSIVTTAHNDSAFLKQAINQRVRGYVSKPLNMHNLIESIVLVSEPKYLRDKLEKLNKKLELEIEKKTYELKSILDSQDNLILVLNDDSTFEVNKTLLDFFGYKDVEEFEIKHNCITELFIAEKNYFTSNDTLSWTDEIMKLEDNKRVVLMRNTQNKNIIFRVNVRSFVFNSKHIVISFTDITDLKHYTYELQYQATHDHLTRLYNRQKFNYELEKEIKRENRYRHGLCLMMLDIDNFKNINDTYGHDIGDIVLKDISNIIINSIRVTDYACRWGGEEFMVLLSETTVENGVKISETIRKNIEEYKNSTIPDPITVSIGVAQFEIDKDSIDSFIKKVDISMYDAKNSGKNKVVKYEK